jgi:hypothetical protein
LTDRSIRSSFREGLELQSQRAKMSVNRAKSFAVLDEVKQQATEPVELFGRSVTAKGAVRLKPSSADRFMKLIDQPARKSTGMGRLRG